MSRPADLAVRVALVAALAASCTVGPDVRRPAPPTVDRYTAAGDPAAAGRQRFRMRAELAWDWWRLFRCRALDAVVAEALANNASLQAGVAALREAQEALRAGYGVFFPQVGADAVAGRERFNPAPFGGPIDPEAGAAVGDAAAASVFSVYSLAGNVSYALDLWGGNRRLVEALGAQVDVQRYALLGTYLALTSNVVNTVIAAAGYREQLRVTRLLVVAQQDQIAVARARYDAGLTAYDAVAALEAQLAATRATIPALEQRLAQAEHLLTRLVGRTPAEWTPPRIDLADLTLPRDLPVSVPSRLVRQRPDVLLAEAQLHASTAQIGVAAAAMLPNVTLSGSLGWSSNAVGTLFDSTSLVWNLLAAVTQPLFDGGTRAHRRRQATYARDVARAQYRETVLQAFEQVANALRALEHDAAAFAAQREAVVAARTSLRLARVNQRAGTSEYLDLLVANAQYLQAQLGYVEAHAQRLQDTVLLFVALGGGWWNAPGAGARARRPRRRRARSPGRAVGRPQREDRVAERAGTDLAHVDLGGHVDPGGEPVDPIDGDRLGRLAAQHDPDPPPDVVLGRHPHVLAGGVEDALVQARHRCT